jgi:1-acyl-sn-glycerol-3-phosphate acyltransferase
VTAIQGHWLRALGFVGWAFLLLTVALAAIAIYPDAEWPRFLLGFSAGLPHSPLLLSLLASVPARQRFATMLLYHGIAGIPAIGLIAALHFGGASLSPTTRFGILAALALIATIVFTWMFWRSFVELINEVVFRPMWYPIAYGPGATGLPTRGGFLIIGNHSAMFDPVWLAAVIPLRSRALMLSTFMDRPFLKWLTGTVYNSIRVPEEGFRRNMPELDEAIATLQRGESVMLFPEAWIRRRQDQPMRRFAQGIHKILQQVPQTPVISCWVEDGWGTFASYKNGPPGKGKPFDILKRIRIGVSLPEVLPADVLASERATRRHLMLAVLNARTYLGLPAHPLPVYGTEKDDGKNGEAE